MLVVVNFDGRIDAATHGHLLHRAVLARDLQRQILLRFEARIQAHDVIGLRAVELEAEGGGAFLELQGQHAHAHEVAAVNAFEALRHDGFHAKLVSSTPN